MKRVMWQSRHAFWTRHSDLLLENYRVERGDRTTVAGRSARIFRIRSKHDESHRPSVRLAVDEETDIVLRYESFDWTGGDATVVAEFTSVDLDPGEMTDRPKRPERRPGFDMWGMPPRAPRADPPLEFTPHTPRWLPEGFEATFGPMRVGRGRNGTKTVYSDGLAWFTLQQRKELAGREERVVRCGKRGSRVTMKMAHEGVDIKIYGSIDPKDIERVLGSLGHAE
jgi:negative regulator of sigma E activity